MQSERYGPHDVFSAVLVVDQDPAMGPPALLYNVSLDEMLGADGRPVSPDVRGNSGWININFEPDRIRRFVRNTGAAIGSPMLRAGDLYVFSSSRVHETFSVRGRARVTLATFASWNSFEEGGEVQLWQ